MARGQYGREARTARELLGGITRARIHMVRTKVKQKKRIDGRQPGDSRIRNPSAHLGSGPLMWPDPSPERLGRWPRESTSHGSGRGGGLRGRPRGVPLVGSQTGRGEDHPCVLGGSAQIAQTERMPRGGPPPLASHRGIGMPSQRVLKHEVDQGGTSPLVSQTDMKEDHQVTVGSVEHTIQIRCRARGFTTLFRRRKGRRPGGSRGPTTSYVDRCSKGERGSVGTSAGRGAQG